MGEFVVELHTMPQPQDELVEDIGELLLSYLSDRSSGSGYGITGVGVEIVRMGDEVIFELWLEDNLSLCGVSFGERERGVIGLVSNFVGERDWCVSGWESMRCGRILMVSLCPEF